MARRAIAWACVAFALSLTSRSAVAQTGDTLAVGTTVRVRFVDASPAALRGRVVRIEPTGFILHPAGAAAPRGVSQYEVARIERFDGTLSDGQAFLRGAKVGALAGLTLTGFMTALALIGDDRESGRVGALVFVSVVGVPLTGLLTTTGGVVGLLAKDRWTRVRYVSDSIPIRP